VKEANNKSSGINIREFKNRKSTSDLDKPGTGAYTEINRHRATDHMIGKDTLAGSQELDPRVLSRWTTGGEWPRPRESECVCGENEIGGNKKRVYHGTWSRLTSSAERWANWITSRVNGRWVNLFRGGPMKETTVSTMRYILYGAPKFAPITQVISLSPTLLYNM
jgi:hypothetical protein